MGRRVRDENEIVATAKSFSLNIPLELRVSFLGQVGTKRMILALL